MKFLADMPISPRTIEFLRRKGYHAIRVDKLKMAKATDREIFDYAIKNEMIIITTDLDFGTILAYTKKKKPSIIILRLKNPSPKVINDLLEKGLPNVEEYLRKGAIIVIGEDKIRIRELPILD